MASRNKRFAIAKIDPNFKRKINEIALERIKRGIDKKVTREQQSIRRYTKAMTRYEPLWDLLMKAKFKEDEYE